MKSSTQKMRLLAAAFLLFLGGCAPAYHSYSGCRVNCRYCPPCPLAYPHYCGCQCHSCAASKYLVAESIVSELPFDERDPVENEADEVIIQ